ELRAEQGRAGGAGWEPDLPGERRTASLTRVAAVAAAAGACVAIRPGPRAGAERPPLPHASRTNKTLRVLADAEKRLVVEGPSLRAGAAQEGEGWPLRPAATCCTDQARPSVLVHQAMLGKRPVRPLPERPRLARPGPPPDSEQRQPSPSRRWSGEAQPPSA
ncbi:hypothetical protein MC885_009744, partial [Smutsia gigantea]